MDEKADRCARCNNLNLKAIPTEFAHDCCYCSTETGHIKRPKIELQDVEDMRNSHQLIESENSRLRSRVHELEVLWQSYKLSSLNGAASGNESAPSNPLVAHHHWQPPTPQNVPSTWDQSTKTGKYPRCTMESSY